MNVNITKILAYGTSRRFMWLLMPNGTEYCLSISKELYKELKKHGVPTCQKLRWQKTPLKNEAIDGH